MTEYEIPLPPSVDPGVVVRLVESICVATGLTVTMKGTLRKYPGTQWRFERGREAGVLGVRAKGTRHSRDRLGGRP